MSCSARSPARPDSEIVRVLCRVCTFETVDSANFCPQCGAPLKVACSACGRPVAVGTAACNTCGAEIDEPRGRGASTDASVQRRQLTAMFCDVVDSVLLGESLDEEDLHGVIREFQVRCARVLRRYGARIDRHFGDAILVYFGYPRADESDAQRAVLAALGIIGTIADYDFGHELGREIRLAVRIGIHTGPVVIAEIGGGHPQDRQVLGHAMNLAARLQSVAEPNTVVISAETLELVQGLFIIEERGMHYLKGIRDPVPVFRVVRPSGVRSRLDTVPARNLTPFVGRYAEFSDLIEGWRDVRGGRGRAVFLAGEAGVGKSRLVRALRDALAGTPHTWLESGCSPFFSQTAFFPIIELLQRVLASVPSEEADTDVERLRTVLGGAEIDLAHAVPLFARLLSLPLSGQETGPAADTPERIRRDTIDALVEWVVRTARRQETVLLIEDLHWSDPSTREFIGRLLERIQDARVLCLFTHRSEFALPWPTGPEMSIRTLSRLNDEQAALLAARASKGTQLTEPMVQMIVAKSDGIPLFIEELAKAAQEFPMSLRDLLTARLDALSHSARDSANVAAALGREFSYAMLRAASDKDDAVLRNDVSELTRASLVYPTRPGGDGDGYVFRHALLCDAAYESMTRTARRSAHRRVSEMLQRDFAAVVQQRPELLGLHLERGGEFDASAAYWVRAGRRSYARAAYAEAQAHLDHALELLRGLPPTGDTKRRELEATTMLGTVLISVRGWAAVKVEETFAAAMKLCAELGGDLPPLVVYGLWSVYITRGDPTGIAALVPRMHGLADNRDQIIAAHMGNACLGAEAVWRGDFVTAHAYFEAARRNFDPGRRFSYDGRIYSYAWDAWLLWVLGYAEQAQAMCDQAFGIAREAGDPYSMAVALAFAGMLAHDLSDFALADSTGVTLLNLCEEQHMPYWNLSGYPRGRARVFGGEVEEGTRLIVESLERDRDLGVMSRYNYYLLYLAEAHLAADRPEDALTVVDQSLALCRSIHSRLHEGELLRLRGEALARRGENAAARESLDAALRMADRSDGRAYALRAAMALARLAPSDETRATLQRQYDRFSEGFATADLRSAAQLLSAL
jgi:class 3 adenylate cyclase/tetratricopeptide (TPR) repeat protein